MQVQTDQIILIVIGITLFFLLVAALLVLYIYIYNNRKRQHIQEKARMQRQFETALLQSQLETQEQTRQYIAEELHDNVGALSSLIKINLNLLGQARSEEKRAELIADSKALVRTLIGELKQLVIGLNSNTVRYQGWINAVQAEAERIEKLQLFGMSLSVSGEERTLKDDRQIILYRMCQELLHNIIKHASAREVKMDVRFEDQQLTIRITDDGAGFDTGAAMKKAGASGLANLHNRAALIGGALTLKSEPGKGTDCLISIPYN